MTPMEMEITFTILFASITALSAGILCLLWKDDEPRTPLIVIISGLFMISICACFSTLISAFKIFTS